MGPSDVVRFRLRMKNHTRPPTIANPAITPTTIPAMAPPDMPELCLAVVEAEEERAGRAFSVLDHESSQLGGFLAGVRAVSYTHLTLPTIYSV